MLVDIVSTDMIKPSSPTPDHLRLHNLSLVDQLFPPIYTTLLLYYLNNDNITPQRTSIICRLKKSLSEILTRYYPFAGRISVHNASVECTDVGVPFKEAIVSDFSISLMEFLLKKRDPNMLKQFLPVKGSVFDEAGLVPLQIQATFFKCGGMVLGLCASHKIMDGAALFAFVRSWASYSTTNSRHEEDKTKLDLQLTLLSSLVPSSDLLQSITTGQQAMKPVDDDYVITKIFVFKAASIAALKATYSATRVQTVSALIWKCAIKATKSNNTILKKKSSSSIMLVAVNMRTRLDPPLPKNSIGNFIGNFNVQKDYDEDSINSNNIDLGELAAKMKNGVMGFCDDYVKKLQLCKEDMGSVILKSAMESRDIVMRQDIDLFHHSSWCGFKFYEVDFGWGKPTWVSTTSGVYKNVFVLIDAEDDYGIEAWVTLTKQDMTLFEQDVELLSFVSVFPTQ